MKTHLSPVSHNQSQTLHAYLIGLGGITLLASTSNAAVVALDITSISGANAGVPVGGQAAKNLSNLDPGLTGTFNIHNDPDGTLVGLMGYNGGKSGVTKVAGVKGSVGPTRFGGDTTIDATSSFISDHKTFFYYGSKVPAWNAESYLGFYSANSHYGWLEVTWKPDINTFEVLSGAYESDANVGITTPIPEPSTLALLVAGAGAIAALRRRKTAAKA